MAIAKLQNIYVVAKDVERLAAFYEDGLGLTAKFSDGARWRQLSAGPDNFAISCEDEAPVGAAGFIAVFEAGDQAQHDDILASGGAFVSQRDMGEHGVVATYTDPEGNFFQVFNRAGANAPGR